ncbi:effector-associated domain EAD1-containing protein [Deinococcus sp. 6GRE01]|uniref:effector-associated domain EAD1-containing protein n=1 Tax=Deinococcus sp. 6GRE01 TaxID=2745873 RepID=UPI001E591563|nr:effector-associated domain EAD1-containing protein [Deinococcus sp. 6GRE01]MCD0159284.1 hypothetical protein [Deinococcus sp. 6GRE01]
MTMTTDQELNARRDLVTYLATAHPTLADMRAIWTAAGGHVSDMPDNGDSPVSRWWTVLTRVEAGRLHPDQFAQAIQAARPGDPTAALNVLGWGGRQ